MNESSETVKELGEQELLKRLLPFCSTDLVGDDAAVLAVKGDRSLVVTTDVLVEAVHFSDRTTDAEDVGWRAVAANLSDLAAMGADPIGITVGLSLRGDLQISWVDGLYRGLSECLQKYNTPLLGGDVCRSSVNTVAITALGQVLPQRIIRRGVAQPGDAVLVTGFHGASRAGLELLLHPHKGELLDPTQGQALIAAHQRPKPRLDVLEFLAKDIRVAGMDSSDGLADAVVQICRASSLGAEIEREAIPVPISLEQIVSPEQALEWALYGGEDFELVLCLEPKSAQTLVSQLGEGAAIIGKITAQPEVELVEKSGDLRRKLTLTGGFQHF